MSRRAIKSINWTAIFERLPEAERNNYLPFKTRCEMYMRRISANPESLPRIDWSYYKKNVTTPGLVDKFQKEYEALKIPYPTDKYSKRLEEEAKQTDAEIDSFIVQIDQQADQCRKVIEEVMAQIPVSQMTQEEFAINFPEEALTPERPTCWPHDPNQEAEMAELEKRELKGH